MSTVHERMPAGELAARHQRCREMLAERLPDASGILVFSPVNIYYLSGTLAFSSIVWLPREGEPVLMVRRGIARARLESPLARIVEYRTYGDVARLCAEAGSPLGDVLGVEQAGLNWGLGDKLRAKFPEARFTDASQVLQRTRAVKTPFELTIIRDTCERHAAAFTEFAATVRPGMNENDIAWLAWNICVAHGHCGVMRVTSLESEAFFGQVAVGGTVNQPFFNDGTIGYIGPHPAMPYMGSDKVIWGPDMLLIADTTLGWKGYYSDKTMVFWSGKPQTFPDTLRRAQDTCMEIEQRCAELMRPGTTPAELWQTAKAIAEKAGFAEGFMGLGGNKVSFVGHGIGLMSDEWPAVAGGFNDPLEPGMLLAMEPKIGIAEYGMVGVENMFEVTPEGGRCLSGTVSDVTFIEG